MKIEVKLDNPKHCDGCPCRQERKSKYELGGACYQFTERCGKYPELGILKAIRPEICITENGE